MTWEEITSKVNKKYKKDYKPSGLKSKYLRDPSTRKKIDETVSVRDSKNYLVISSAHLGLTNEVLQVLKSFVDEYGCQVIHTGPLVSQIEKKMYMKK